MKLKPISQVCNDYSSGLFPPKCIVVSVTFKIQALMSAINKETCLQFSQAIFNHFFTKVYHTMHDKIYFV